MADELITRVNELVTTLISKLNQVASKNSTTNKIVSNQVRRAALTGDVTANENSNATTLKSSIKQDIQKGVDAKIFLDGLDNLGNPFSIGRFVYSTNAILNNGDLMPIASEELYGSESMFSDPADGRIAISQSGLYRITANAMLKGTNAGTVSIESHSHQKVLEVGSGNRGKQYYYSYIEEFDISGSLSPYIEVRNAFNSMQYTVIVEVEKLT